MGTYTLTYFHYYFGNWVASSQFFESCQDNEEVISRCFPNQESVGKKEM